MEQEIKNLIDSSVSVFNVIGPFIIYIPQYLLMGNNKSVGSFSHFICYIMLLAHILRLIFHQMINYHISLYLQSYFMILIHSVLLFQYIRVRHYEKLHKSFETDSTLSQEPPLNELELMDCEKRTPSNQDQLEMEIDENEDSDRGSRNFNVEREETLERGLVDEDKEETLASQMSLSTDLEHKDSTKEDTDFMLKQNKKLSQNALQIKKERGSHLNIPKYITLYQQRFIKIMMVFLSFGVAYFLIFRSIHKKWFADWTALLSCLCESMLPVPQFIANCKLKSFESLSFFMVCCWLFGDLMKFFFLLDENQPLQFVIGTANIIVFDVLIVGQYFMYKNKGKKRKMVKEFGGDDN